MVVLAVYYPTEGDSEYTDEFFLKQDETEYDTKRFVHYLSRVEDVSV